MTSPRHLWSGDWQLDSEAAAEELARRRARPEPPPEPGPEPPPGPTRPSLRQRIKAAFLAAIAAGLRSIRSLARRRPRASRRTTALVLIGCLTLLSAGIAFAVTSVLVDSGKHKDGPGARAWLGVKMADASQGGVRIVEVTPGGPAAIAGLQTGDVITAINSQQVQSVRDVSAALDGLVAGNTIQLQFDRGPSGYSTQVTLAPPRGSP